MNKKEAITAMLNGDKVRRVCWGVGYWYAFDPNETFDTELAIEMIEICLKEKNNPVGIEAKEIQSLKEQLKRERECVDFYADTSNWHGLNTKKGNRYINRFDMEMINCDGKWGGKKAREPQKARLV